MYARTNFKIVEYRVFTYCFLNWLENSLKFYFNTFAHKRGEADIGSLLTCFFIHFLFVLILLPVYMHAHIQTMNVKMFHV